LISERVVPSKLNPILDAKESKNAKLMSFLHRWRKKKGGKKNDGKKGTRIQFMDYLFVNLRRSYFGKTDLPFGCQKNLEEWNACWLQLL
jgi:hypothetical protein